MRGLRVRPLLIRVDGLPSLGIGDWWLLHALVSAFVLPPPAKVSSQAIQQNSEELPGELLAKCQFYQQMPEL
jgi:hypothetical protein